MNSSYKRLFIWVEGNDDERFFKNLLKFGFYKKYNFIEIIKYAHMRRDKIVNFIKSIKSMGADYIFVTDINNSPCITAKKEEIKKRFKIIDTERVMVVVKEIEGWYLAGLDHNACKKLKINNIDNTANITKEKFNALIPKRFSSKIDFMTEILKIFSVEIAKYKNKSFEYFISKYDC